MVGKGWRSAMRLTANHLTVLRVALLPLPYFLVYGGKMERVAAVAAFAVLGITDYLDGLLARRDGGTKLGALLDPLADKIFAAVTLIPIVDLRILPMWVVWPIFLREFLVTEMRRFLLVERLELPVTELAKIKTTLQMTGAGLILLTDVFPDKTVSAAFLSGALLASLFLAIGLYWRNGYVSERIKTALGFLVLGLFVLIFFSAPTANLVYGIVMLGITFISAWRYITAGLPACAKKGLLVQGRLILALAFPLIPLGLMTNVQTGVTGVVVFIIVFEFVAQGIDMWALKEGLVDMAWVKPFVCLPAGMVILAVGVNIFGSSDGIRLYLLATSLMSGGYLILDGLIHRRLIWRQRCI
ncbi:MAG: CDP-alcohol phosphatidyltransferase family protein [Dissulfurimicrobium hydrothermale]|uniref:CDP-alcohol phosphatidyltransferase family protein n=2 Tax=Dissulfurimicrobium hydrothermale TaxID=1750598 RepID=UPI003C78F114